MRPKRLAMCLVVLLPLLLGADTITFDKATPNPEDKPMLLLCEGAYPEQEFVIGVVVFAKGPGEQHTAALGTFDPKSFAWKATLRLAPGQYECWAMLVTLNLSTRQPSTAETERKNVTVK